MRPRQDFAASETLAETLKLPRLLRVLGASTSRRDVFTTYGETHWQLKNVYGLINSHHGKCFPFVIMWVCALYFDIIAE